MIRKSFFVLMVIALALAGCKPVAYYLQQVYKVHGKVADSTTAAPLESVEVLIHGYQYSELTNGLGDYEIEMAEGTWTLDFVKEGYITFSQVMNCGPTVPRQELNVQLVPDGSWIVGEWVFARPHLPGTDLTILGSDGQGTAYDDVYGERLLLAFGWTLNGDTLTMTSPDGTVKLLEWTVSKISNDEFTVSPQPGNNHFYRKFPGDNIFTKQETQLSSSPTTVVLAGDDAKLYSFTALTAGSYTVSWSAETGYIQLHAYQTDQRTVVFEYDGGSPWPTVSLDAGQKIFIVASSGSAPATLELVVQPAG